MKHYLGTIRSRVAFSHVLLVTVTMVAFIVVASSLFWWHLTHQLYRHAIQNVETAEGLLSINTDGSLILREDYHNHPESRLVHRSKRRQHSARGLPRRGLSFSDSADAGPTVCGGGFADDNEDLNLHLFSGGMNH